jgi:hypothetical protein
MVMAWTHTRFCFAAGNSGADQRDSQRLVHWPVVRADGRSTVGCQPMAHACWLDSMAGGAWRSTVGCYLVVYACLKCVKMIPQLGRLASWACWPSTAA